MKYSRNALQQARTDIICRNNKKKGFVLLFNTIFDKKCTYRSKLPLNT